GREAVALHGQEPELGVGVVEEGEAEEHAVAGEAADEAGVLGVGFELPVVLDLLEALGHGGEDVDHLVAAPVEVVGEGEAVVPGELETWPRTLGKALTARQQTGCLVGAALMARSAQGTALASLPRQG